MEIKIIQGDITTIECDAIVCSTNSKLIPDGSIDAAIHKAAGPELTQICADIKNTNGALCFITRGYNLPCKYIIHVVAPHAGDDSSDHLLSQCYKRALKNAVSKNVTSVAFPLIGSGSRGFSVRRALDIALTRFEACRHEYDFDLTVYLVLFYEETLTSALTLAQEKNMDIKFVPSNNEISPTDKHWISLCRVNRPDKNMDIWMQRLADSINGSLVAPTFDEAKERIFDNRPLIFYESGPSAPDNVGFWEWTEQQNEFGKWQSNATYIAQPTPIEIIILDKCSGVADVVDALKNGIYIPAYVRSSVLFAAKNGSIYEGVLCDLSKFNVSPGGDQMFITVKENIYNLPCYELSEQDIFTWKYRQFYKHISLEDTSKRVPIYDRSETIKQLFLQRMSWPVFKAQGILKNDWQKFKQFLIDIPKDSIIEQLSETCSMSQQEAQSYIDKFLQTVESHIDASDVDSALIVQVLSNHHELRAACDDVAYKKWCDEHKAEIEKAKAEVAAIRSEAEQEVALTQQQLKVIQSSISAAELVHKGILADISAAESKFQKICADIEEYETLGNETLSAVRQKIADAQNDVAGFIADISVFLPQTQPQVSTEAKTQLSPWRYECAPVGAYSDDIVEFSETWNDELNAISQNLAHSLGINGDFGGMLSAFLYATHINETPLLIAGPGGRDFADVTAVSLYASSAGHLRLGNESSNNIAETIADYEEQIVAVQNMFSKGWHDELPQEFTKLKKQVIWTHPYVEDMVIEPKGLYNYMIPVLSECFIGSISALEPWPTKRSENFKAYVSSQKQPLKLSAFKRLKLSKLLLNQLTLALSDAKALLNQPSKDKDMEVLFGLLPLCVVTGRIDILKEVIETESGISSAVKAEAMRYIEEE